MRRLLTRACDAAALVATLFAFAITHFPAPTGVGRSEADPSRQAVRGVWHLLGELAHRVDPYVPEIPDALASDKTIHFGIYLAPGFFWAISFALRRRLDLRGAAFLWLALGAWAALDETSQALLARQGEVGDWVANAVGAAVGIGVARGVVAGVRWGRRRVVG